MTKNNIAYGATKVCSKCEVEKELCLFYKDKTHKDGYTSNCKQCKNSYHKKWIIDKKEIISEYNKNYHEDNKAEHNKNSKIYHKINREKVYKVKKTWTENNKHFVRKYMSIYNKVRRKEDALFRLTCNVRSSIKTGLKTNKKNHKSIEILGCSINKFKTHLESLFEPWMNWDNYGLYNGEPNYGWDIDHIIPLSSANTENDLIRLNHYSNLQPLCSKFNRYIKKNNHL